MCINQYSRTRCTFLRYTRGASAVPWHGPILSFPLHRSRLHHPDEPAGRSGCLRHPGAGQVRQTSPAPSAGKVIRRL